MRLRVYIDGKPDWADQGPSTPLMHASRGGQLVVGEQGISAREQRRRQANAEAAKRYRERQR